MASVAQYTAELATRPKAVPPSDWNWDLTLVEQELDWGALLADKKNIFIIGLGGGSDVIGALATAVHIEKTTNKTKEEITLGIGKDPKRPERINGLASLTTHIFRTPAEVETCLQDLIFSQEIQPFPDMPTWGTWTLEQTIPRYKGRKQFEKASDVFRWVSLHCCSPHAI